MRSGGVGGNILESPCHCVLLSLISARHSTTLSPTSSLCPEFVHTVFSEPLNLFVNQLGIVVHHSPEGKLGMSDVSLLSGISGLSFWVLLSCFFLPSPPGLSVLSFFC